MKSTHGLSVMFSILGMVAQACGQAENGPGTEALARIEGSVAGAADAAELRDPQVGVVWLGDQDVNGPIVGEVAPISVAQTPADFVLELFQEPPARAFLPGRSGEPALAMGFLFVVDDANRDGEFAVTGAGLEAPDRLLGMSFENVLLYVAGSRSDDLGEMIDNVDSATNGYHLARALCAGDRSFQLEIVPNDTPVAITLGTAARLVAEAAIVCEEP